MNEKREKFPSDFQEKEREDDYEPVAMAKPAAAPASNNALFPILAYCGSSILMTLTNKYVLSGLNFNLNFFLLMVQVCFQLPEEDTHTAN